MNNTMQPVKLTQFKFYSLVLVMFSATWLISNIAAVKLISIFGISLTGGFIIFPVTSMLSILIVEVYGYKNARQTIWLGFLLNIMYIFFINIVNILPSSPYWNLQHEFHSILVPSTRIIIASITSFVLSDFSNSYIMAKLKIQTKGNSLLKRILFAYTCSITIDILCFIIMAFGGTLPTSVLLKLVSMAFIKKMICQTALLPVVWFLIDLLKQKEGIDIYDYKTKFNPFSFDNVYDFSAYKKLEKNNIKSSHNVGFSTL